MGNHHLHTKEFIVAAAVGSLLGGVAALLIAPKAGSDLRGDISDAYCSMSDKTQHLAGKGKSFAKNFGCHSCDWSDKAKSFLDSAKKSVNRWRGEEEEEENTTKDLLIGGLIGGLLGVAAGLLLAPKPGGQLRRNLSDAYDDMSERGQEFAENLSKQGKSFAKKAQTSANKWVKLATHLVEDLTGGIQEKGEEWVDQVKELVNNRRIHDVIDWAHLGYRVWNGIQSKNR
jgi:gas vesicle protein